MTRDTGNLELLYASNYTSNIGSPSSLSTLRNAADDINVKPSNIPMSAGGSGRRTFFNRAFGKWQVVREGKHPWYGGSIFSLFSFLTRRASHYYPIMYLLNLEDIFNSEEKFQVNALLTPTTANSQRSELITYCITIYHKTIDTTLFLV